MSRQDREDFNNLPITSCNIFYSSCHISLRTYCFKQQKTTKISNENYWIMARFSSLKYKTVVQRWHTHTLNLQLFVLETMQDQLHHYQICSLSKSNILNISLKLQYKHVHWPYFSPCISCERVKRIC